MASKKQKREAAQKIRELLWSAEKVWNQLQDIPILIPAAGAVLDLKESTKAGWKAIHVLDPSPEIPVIEIDAEAFKKP